MTEGLKAFWRRLTPSQRLWLAVFPRRDIPDLDEEKVLSLVEGLESREALVVKLRFGFGCTPATMEQIARRVPRLDGEVGVSPEMVRKLRDSALRHLRRRRAAWERARR